MGMDRFVSGEILQGKDNPFVLAAIFDYGYWLGQFPRTLHLFFSQNGLQSSLGPFFFIHSSHWLPASPLISRLLVCG